MIKKTGPASTAFLGVMALVVLASQQVPASDQTMKHRDSGVMFLWDPAELSGRNRNSDLPGDRRYEMHGKRGFALTEDKESPLYLAQIEQLTGKVLRVDPKTGEETLVYQWLKVEATDLDGDQIFFLGEHNPPEPRRFRILHAVGKYYGMQGSGDLGWEAATRLPDGPDGSMQVNYSLDYTDPDPGYQPQPMFSGDLPPEEEWVTGFWVFKEPRQLLRQWDKPDGSFFDYHDEEGFWIIPSDTSHPLHGVHAHAPSTVLLKSRAWGADFEAHIYEFGIIIGTDKDGDQFFVLVNVRPGIDMTGGLLKGTGKFEGATFYGTGVPIKSLEIPEDHKPRIPGTANWPDGTEINEALLYLKLAE